MVTPDPQAERVKWEHPVTSVPDLIKGCIFTLCARTFSFGHKQYLFFNWTPIGEHF